MGDTDEARQLFLDSLYFENESTGGKSSLTMARKR